MLRVFAMLVQFVVSTFQMNRRHARVNATRAVPAALPRMTTDTVKEQQAANHRSPIALILSSTLRVRRVYPELVEGSKDEGVLTTLSHNSPSPSVSLTTSAIHLPLLRMGRQGNEGELPPSVRRTGGGGLRALARKTEGASPILRH